MLFTADLSNMPVEAESRVIVRFQDCDPLMHLNNSKYFEYFFNAREDQVSKLYGFSFEAMFRELKTSWVVYQHQIAYIRPALISEWTRITSRVIHYNEDTMVTEYFMTNDQRTELKTLLWTTSKHISIVTEKGYRITRKLWIIWLPPACRVSISQTWNSTTAFIRSNTPCRQVLTHKFFS
jgi:acyl-CoA thioester hydrolase